MYGMQTLSPSFPANVKRYNGGIFRAPQTSATETDVQTIFASNKTVSMLTVKLKTAQPVGTDLTITVRKNGTSTSLQIVVPGGTPLGTILQDTVNSVNYVGAVDLFSIEFDNVGPSVSAQLENVIVEAV